MPTLCYREVSIIQDITGVPSEGYNPFFFGVDGDALVFRFTQDSFLKVLSALTNGAYITYGDEGRQVVWDFLVNVEYPVSICDLVAECFASDAEFRASVINSLKSDPLFREAVQEISKVGQPLIGGQITGPLVAECDKDAAWSGVLALVQQMSNVNVDFFQFMESQTNELEKISALVSDIPIFGTISASLTSQLVNTLIEDGQENYEGIVTDALLEEYACGLFCIMSDDPSCSLTFNQMYDYFRDRIAGTFNITDALSTVLEFIVTGTYAGTALVDFMFMTQIAILRDANDFMGFDYVNMQITIDAGMASPSDAWELLCDCVPPPPEDLWFNLQCDGTAYVEQITGPTSGPGTYSFVIHPYQRPSDNNWIGYFRWANDAEQFVVNSIATTQTPGEGVGNGWNWPPGIDNACDDVTGVVNGLPVADSTTLYGGVGESTFPGHEWQISINITVSTI